jgi:hypothetical protein
MHELVLELIYLSATGEVPDCDGGQMVLGTFLSAKPQHDFKGAFVPTFIYRDMIDSY